MIEIIGKKVVVFGLGRSGISAAKFLIKKGVTPYLVNRGNPDTWGDLEGIELSIPTSMMLNQDCATSLMGSADLIVLSPGIPREHQALMSAHKAQVPVVCEIELASWFCSPKYIVITGSNGKTTTTSMIYEMFKASGKNVFVGGNIGIPFCECLIAEQNPEYVVLELSSFQLESMPSFHPHIALILNIFHNHGERYDRIEDYAKAKFNVMNNMKSSDWIVYPSDLPIVNDYCAKQPLNHYPIELQDREKIIKELSEFLDLEKIKVHGFHNKLNLYFALAVMKISKLPIESFQKMAYNFLGVEHRLQFLPSNDSFMAFNDAKSTNWDALKTAVSSIDKNGRELWVIIGGQRRGKEDSIKPHIDLIKKYVEKVILIGDTTDEFFQDLSGQIPVTKSYRLEDAVMFARQQKFSGILLLSPAFPSYDQYKNFNKRGEHFIQLIQG